MKKSFIALFILMLASVANGQNASVEKSVFGIQTGILGIWVNNESKLSDKGALRTEIGFDGGFFFGSFYDKPGLLLTPVLTIEPRWYYNLAKRNSESKKQITTAEILLD